MKPPDFTINFKMDSYQISLTSKIEHNSHVLENYLGVYVGIVANGIKKFLSSDKLNSSYKKYLQGRHINQYKISPEKLFIRFDINKLHSNTDENVYLQKEKLLVRKTGNVLIAAYDSKQYYTDQSIYNLYPLKYKDLNLKYILALLNSKMMNFYFNKKMVTNPDVFPYIKGIHLKQLPIKNTNLGIQTKFITLVDKILILKEEVPSSKNSDYINKVDIMIYKLYDLTYDEVKIIDSDIEKIISKTKYDKIDTEKYDF